MQKISKPQVVKLQKYMKTAFKGDCKVWLQFWNQFVVEVESTNISEISKFNNLLELVEGEPKEHILGLPHTPEGYHEAKKILEMTFGKDIKVYKALIRDLESLPNITSSHKIKEIHKFYTKLSISNNKETRGCPELCVQHNGQIGSNKEGYDPKR